MNRREAAGGGGGKRQGFERAGCQGPAAVTRGPSQATFWSLNPEHKQESSPHSKQRLV